MMRDKAINQKCCESPEHPGSGEKRKVVFSDTEWGKGKSAPVFQHPANQAGTYIITDGGVDGGTDAGVDGGGNTDAGSGGGSDTDAGADAGNIPCSGQTCSAVTVKNMFVTTATYNGFQVMGAFDADWNCNAAVPTECSGGNYKAMIVYENGVPGTRRACSTPYCSGGTSEHSDWVLQACVQYKRCDGTTVIGTTDPLAGIFCFPLNNSYSDSAGDMWTGLKYNWTTFSGDTCDDWKNSTSNYMGIIGDKHTTSYYSIHKMVESCGQAHPILCVQQ